MPATFHERPADEDEIKELADEITSTVMRHCDIWGWGSKPQVEVITALARAFATVTSRHNQRGVDLMCRGFQLSVEHWWRELDR
jgi:hypothetical protein